MPSTLIMTALYSIGVSAVTISTLAPFIIFGSRLLTAYVISRVFMRNDAAGSIGTDGSRVQLPPATNNKLPVSYGTAWLKPIITDAKISTDQRTMWYVLSLCEVPDASSGFGGGTISYGNIRWADKTLNFDSTDLTKVISWTNDAGETDTRVNGKIYVYQYGDGSNVSINTSLTAIQVLQDSAIASGQRWTSTDVMTKTAFLIVKLNYDQEINLVGLDQITAEVVNSLKDPGGVAYDYLTNERYGCAVPSGQIDVTSLQNLTAYSNQLITYTPVGGGSATRNRFEINGTLDTSQDCFRNLQTIFDSCDSWLQWNEANASWGCVINKAYNQSAGTISAQTLSQLFDINDTNVIGSINLNPIDLNSTYNSVEVSYPDNAIYDQASYVYVNLDPEDKNPNEPDNVLLLSLPLINNAVQAGYIATRRLIQSREDLVVNITMDYSGIQIDAGDLIRFNSTKFQWVDKVFRVTQVQEGKDEQGFLYAQISLIEYNSGMYADNLNISDFIPSPNTGITDPNIATTPTAPTVTNIVNNTEYPRFDVQVQIPVQGRYGSVELWYSTNSDSSIIADYILLTTLLPPDSNSFASGATVGYTVTTLPANANYFFRARVITVTGSQSFYSPASTAFNWAPNVVVPTSLALNYQWEPTTIICTSDSDGSNVVVGQQANLELYIGANIVPVWDKITPATQPTNSWYANTVTGSTGLSVSSLTLDTVNDQISFTITGLTANTAVATVSDAFYKDSTGNVIAVGNTAISVSRVRNGATGNPGTKYGIAYLYQWTSVTPGDPNGTSTFDWSTGTNGSYTGTNGWTTLVGTNPGGPGVKLWIASKQVSAAGTVSTSTVDWTSEFQKYFASENGAGGAQYVEAEVYTWALSTPTISGPDGTYTWSNGSISGIPSPWSNNPGNPPSTGYTLYAARIYLTASSGTLTSPIVWNTASIIAVGYSGSQGANSRTCYARIPGNPSPGSAQITVTGDSPPTQAQSAASSPTGWGLNYAWSTTDPNPSSTDSLFQSNGIYNSVTNTTVWDTPFLSSLRVGQLSSITTNTGNLTVTGQILAGNAAISGNTMTGAGAIIYSTGNFAMGNSTTNITFDGTAVTLNGPLATVAAGQASTGSVETFANAYSWTGATRNVVAITTTGAPVKIMGTVGIQYNVVDNSSTDYGASALFRVRLKMDGNYLANGEYVGQYSTFVSQSGTNRHQVIPLVPVVYRHTPSAGAHNYQIELHVEHYAPNGAAYANSGEMYGQYWFVAEENKI